MEIEEYKKELEDIEQEYYDKKINLLVKFANSNNPYKIGDIIKDHIGTGKILFIKTYSNYNDQNTPSQCAYLCDNLIKTGTINKKEPKRTIYQSNIIKE